MPDMEAVRQGVQQKQVTGADINPEALKAQLRKELRAELKAEMQDEQNAKLPELLRVRMEEHPEAEEQPDDYIRPRRKARSEEEVVGTSGIKLLVRRF